MAGFPWTIGGTEGELKGTRPFTLNVFWHGTRRFSCWRFNGVSRIGVDSTATIGDVSNSAPAEAANGVVIDHSDGLHPGVDDHRADEFEAAFFKGDGDGFGERRAGGDFFAIAA